VEGIVRALTPVAHEAIAAVLVLAAALLVSRVLKRLILGLERGGSLSPRMAARLQAARRWTIVVVAALLLTQALGIFGSAWAVISAALATLALGFVAAWSVLSNATAALLILAFRPFRVGDTVELLESNGTALGGRVLDMNLMYTTLGIEPGPQSGAEMRQVLQIPNNLFFQKVVRTTTAHASGSKAAFFSPPEP
jgi:small-conductance mechanosensitive channel